MTGAALALSCVLGYWLTLLLNAPKSTAQRRPGTKLPELMQRRGRTWLVVSGPMASYDGRKAN